MINKNKKRMVKLFLLAFVILIICYNVYAEELKIRSDRLASFGTGGTREDRGLSTIPETFPIGLQCTIWQPKGEAKCNECMDDEDCSYYECKSKGLNCDWDNGNCYINDCINIDKDEFCDNVDDCIDGDGDGYGDGDGCEGKDDFPNDPNQYQSIDTEPPKIEFIDDDVVNENGVYIKTIRKDLNAFSVKFKVTDQSSSIICYFTPPNLPYSSLSGGSNIRTFELAKFNDERIQLKFSCEDENENSAEAELVVVRKENLYVEFQEYFNEDAIIRGESGNKVDNNGDDMIVKSDRLTKCYYNLNNGKELIFPESTCDKEDRSKTSCMWREVHTALLNDFFTTKGIYNIKIRCIDDYSEEDSKPYENIFVNIEPLSINLNYMDNSNGENKLYKTLTGEVSGGLGTNIECKYQILNGFDSDNDVIDELKGWKYDNICPSGIATNFCGSINTIEKSGENYIINQDLPEPLDGSSKYYGIICRDSENNAIQGTDYVKIKDYVTSLSINLGAGDKGSYADVSIITSGGLYNNGMANCYYKENSANVVNLDNSFTKISDNPNNNFNFKLPKEGVFSSGSHRYHFICVDANVEKNYDKESYIYEFLPEVEAGALEFTSFKCFNCEDISDEKDVGGFTQIWALETSGGLYGNGKADCSYNCQDENENGIYNEFDDTQDVGNSYLHKKSFSINENIKNNEKYICKFKCNDDNKIWEQQTGTNLKLKDLRLKTPELRVEDIKVVEKSMTSREIIVKTSGGYDKNGKARCMITDNLLDELKDNSKDDFFNDNIAQLKNGYPNWYFDEMDRDAKSSYDDEKLVRLYRKTIPVSKEGTYSYWIECRDVDAKGRYSTNRNGKEKMADLIQFSVEFNDLTISITKPISGEVKGLETAVGFETRGGTNNDGDVSKCEILENDNVKATVNRNREDVITGIYSNNKLIGRKFSTILTGLKEGPNSYQIKCYDNTYPNIITGVVDLGFNAVVESFLIDTDNLDDINNIDKAKFNWIVTTSGGIKGSGKGSCSYFIKNMNQVEVNKDNFNLVKSEGESSIFSAVIDVKDLNGGVYDFGLRCSDDRTDLEKLHEGISVMITRINCNEGSISKTNAGCYCGNTLTIAANPAKGGHYGTYCCSDGTIRDKEEDCGEIPVVDCTDSKYDAGLQTCTSVGCKWSGNNYKCDTDCYTGWIDSNNDKICEAPEAKTFTVSVTKPQDETTIAQLPVELWVSTQKEANCQYRLGTRNIFNEFEEVSGETYNTFDSASQNKKQFMKNLGSLQNKKYIYHVHCDALDGTNDYGDAYVDFTVNIAGGGCTLDCDSDNNCISACATTSECEADPDCVTPREECDNDQDCDGILDSQDKDNNTPIGCHVDYRGKHMDKDKDNVCDCNPEIDETPQCDKCLGTINNCEPVDTNDGETKGCPTLEACEKDACVDDKYCKGAGNCGACGTPLFGTNFNCPQLLCHSLGDCYWQDKLWNFDLCSDCPSSCSGFGSDGESCVNEDDYCDLNCYWDTINSECKIKPGESVKKELNDCNTNCDDNDGCTCPSNCVKTEVKDNENCGGIPGACVNQAIDSQPTGCTGNNYCDGQGSCVSMYWRYDNSGILCKTSNTYSKCTPSKIYTNLVGQDTARRGVIPTAYLSEFSESGQATWCDQYACAVGSPNVLDCQGSEPMGIGVIKGVSSYPEGYQTISWTNISDGRILGACEWKCDTNYVPFGNSCVTSTSVQAQQCSISSINWVNKAGTTISSADDGEDVYGIIRGTNCNIGSSVNYEIKEKDTALGVDELAADDTLISTSISFTTANVAYITWQATRQNDLAAPYNWYYIKINDRESILLEVREVVSDARRTVLTECTKCNDPDGCTCPDGCSIVGDINRRQNCGQAIEDKTPPQIIQIVSKSARNYILTNEAAFCYISANKDGPWDNGLSREGGKKHLITLSGAYYIKCIDLAGNWGGVVSIS